MTTWEDLAASALLGTQRRPVDVAALNGPLGEAAAALPAEDPAAALLDAAALATPYRRAGRRVAAHDGALPAPAPGETLPEVPRAAAARLAYLLDSHDRALLPEWLAAAGARGYRVPYDALPPLLDLAARGETAVRPVVGERGRWLAAHQPHWAAAVGPATAPDPRAWETGTRDERRALLAYLRETAPAEARALLESTWASETGEERAAFVALLAAGLGDGDEPLLERALDDRRKDVREAAAALLRRLPRSAYAARMTAHARAAVTLERRLLRTRVAVTPPAGADAAMVRDGLGGKPPKGFGERAWLLRGIVAATPLAAWRDITGMTPRQLLDAPVDKDWRDELVSGWYDATVAQRVPEAAEWAGALLAYGPRTEWVLELLPVADEAARTAYVLSLLKAPKPDAAVLATFGPWPDPVARAVVERLARPALPPDDWAMRQWLGLCEEHLPPRRAGDVAAVAARFAPDDPWYPALSRLADHLTFRAEMLEELR